MDEGREPLSGTRITAKTVGGRCGWKVDGAGENGKRKEEEDAVAEKE